MNLLGPNVFVCHTRLVLGIRSLSFPFLLTVDPPPLETPPYTNGGDGILSSLSHGRTEIRPTGGNRCHLQIVWSRSL